MGKEGIESTLELHDYIVLCLLGCGDILERNIEGNLSSHGEHQGAIVDGEGTPVMTLGGHWELLDIEAEGFGCILAE